MVSVSGMARRTHLIKAEKQLLLRLRRGQWAEAELRWLLAHLDEHTPRLVIQEIHAKLIQVRLQRQQADAT
jgi:hypothetical protein